MLKQGEQARCQAEFHSEPLKNKESQSPGRAFFSGILMAIFRIGLGNQA
jgi:hypothetical protein